MAIKAHKKSGSVGLAETHLNIVNCVKNFLSQLFDMLHTKLYQKIEPFNTNGIALDLIYFCLTCNTELMLTNFLSLNACTKAEIRCNLLQRAV